MDLDNIRANGALCGLILFNLIIHSISLAIPTWSIYQTFVGIGPIYGGLFRVCSKLFFGCQDIQRPSAKLQTCQAFAIIAIVCQSSAFIYSLLFAFDIGEARSTVDRQGIRIKKYFLTSSLLLSAISTLVAVLVFSSDAHGKLSSGFILAITSCTISSLATVITYSMFIHNFKYIKDGKKEKSMEKEDEKTPLLKEKNCYNIKG